MELDDRISRPANVGKVIELPRAFCKLWFGRGRWARVGTNAIGSCFYESLCIAINFRGFNSLSSRAARAACVLDFRCSLEGPQWSLESFRKTVEEAPPPRDGSVLDAETEWAISKASLCRTDAWAKTLTIRHIGRILGLNIIIVRGHVPETGTCRLYNNEAMSDALNGRDPTLPTAVILWQRCQHFEPIVRLVSVDDKTAVIQPQLLPALYPADRETVRLAMRTLASGCGLEASEPAAAGIGVVKPPQKEKEWSAESTRARIGKKR